MEALSGFAVNVGETMEAVPNEREDVS